MVKGLFLAGVLALILWAPWMDRTGATQAGLNVAGRHPDLLTLCREGVATSTEGMVSWYPFGRLVHTCTGDFRVMFWGAVLPLASVQANLPLPEIQPVPLSCAQILNTLQERMSTTSTSVEPLYLGATTSINFLSWPGAENYTSALNEGLAKGPVFAGRYALADWSCGVACQAHAVIDIPSGRIVAGDIKSEYGLEYSLDSNILVTNPAKRITLPEDEDVAVSSLLSLARTEREYYRIGIDEISGLPALTRVCVENAALGVASFTP